MFFHDFNISRQKTQIIICDNHQFSLFNMLYSKQFDCNNIHSQVTVKNIDLKKSRVLHTDFDNIDIRHYKFILMNPKRMYIIKIKNPKHLVQILIEVLVNDLLDVPTYRVTNCVSEIDTVVMKRAQHLNTFAYQNALSLSTPGVDLPMLN